MRKKLAWLVLVGVVLTFPVFGCNKGQQADDGKLSIAVIPKSTGAEFWETVEEGAREAAEELNVDMRWEGPLTETEFAEQNRIIENMISLQVDGIALAPLNRVAMKPTVERAVEAGIPVVIFDSSVDTDTYVSFVATDNKLGGRLGAEHLISLLPEGKKRVMVMRFVQGTGSTEARADGFIEKAKEAGLEVVEDPYPADATVAGCKKTAVNTLERLVKDNRLELDGIFACNDRATLGVLEALNDLQGGGVTVDVRFVGFDFTPRLVEAVQKGTIDALIAQNPKKMGRLAVETLVKHLRGEEVPKYIDTGVTIVTKEKLEQDPAVRALVGLK
ncbi:substrate-binding domain-containing protein [Thermostilla marina]